MWTINAANIDKTPQQIAKTTVDAPNCVPPMRAYTIDEAPRTGSTSGPRRTTLGRALRDTFIPALTEGEFPGLDVAAVTRPSHLRATIGSDFCDAFRLRGGTAVVLGEIVGNSIVAPLQIPQIKFALNALLAESPSPARALTALNRWMCHERASARAIRAFGRAAVVIFDDNSDWVEAAAAGAETPLTISGFGSIDPVDISGLPLGIDAGFEYDSLTFRMELGDTLVMTTNGVTNARFGNDVLGILGLKALAKSAWTLTAEDYGIARCIMEGAITFGGGSLRDNATVLTALRTVRNG